VSDPYEGIGVDTTGLSFGLVTHHPSHTLPSAMRNPVPFCCGHCSNEFLWVLVDNSNHAAAGLVCFQCPKCGWRTNDVQLQKPQANAEIAHDLGFYTSDTEDLRKGIDRKAPRLIDLGQMSDAELDDLG
jgi:hypothetical protein